MDKGDQCHLLTESPLFFLPNPHHKGEATNKDNHGDHCPECIRTAYRQEEIQAASLSLPAELAGAHCQDQMTALHHAHLARGK